MPTLFHIKPASLFNISKKTVKETGPFFSLIEQYAAMFDCSCICMYENDFTASLIIYYRPLLDKLLADKATEDYLKACGYVLENDRMDNVLNEWKRRYANYFDLKCKGLHSLNQGYELAQSRAVFPHEIGLILGYPLKDVVAFIKNGGKNYLLSGYWKVYHDREKAVRTFEAFSRARLKAFQVLMAGGGLKDMSGMDFNNYEF